MTETIVSAITDGHVGRGFDRVAKLFSQSLADGTELGASFAVCVDGEVVVDLIGGYTNKEKTERWSQDTIACIYSCGKAVTALLVAKAVSDGLLDYEQPLSHYWPEFSARASSKAFAIEKHSVTLGETISHQAGLPGFAHEVSPTIWLDWEGVCAELASTAPMWKPASASGYHPTTFGYLIGETLRRATGKDVATLLQEFMYDVYCGLSDQQISRTTYMPKPSKAPDLGEINPYTKAAFLNKWSAPAKVTREQWLSAQSPASNMHASAIDLAKFLHPLANHGLNSQGTEIIDPHVLPAFYRERCHGNDLVLPFNLSWSAGVMRNINGHFGPSETAFGHSGFGGSAVIVDPERRLTIAYVMNRMSHYLVGDPRSLALVDIVYECL